LFVIECIWLSIQLAAMGSSSDEIKSASSSADEPSIQVGLPSTWSLPQWHTLRLDQAFPMLGRGGAQKIKQNSGIANRVCHVLITTLHDIQPIL
jgi:hypothetical protein